jgi:hypothetical protein
VKHARNIDGSERDGITRKVSNTQKNSAHHGTETFTELSGKLKGNE